jgi:hypothetical protein
MSMNDNGSGLGKTLLEKFIIPYRKYRGNKSAPGTPTTFNNFVMTRPDGLRDNIFKFDGKAAGINEMLAMGGIDPMRATYNEILSRDDDFKWLLGPWISDIVWRGYAGETDRPAVWARLCFQVGMPCQQESLKRVKLWFKGKPEQTGELEAIPTTQLKHGDESISWKKTAWKLECSLEMLRFSPIPILEPWLIECGRVQQITKDLACVDAIVNGTVSGGGDSCPVIGINAPSTGLVYKDFLKPWGKGQYIREDWFTMLYGLEMHETVGDMKEFKRYYPGTPMVELTNNPQPALMNRFVTPGVPDNQIILMDDSHCVRERTSIPFHIMQEDDIDTYSHEIAFFESYVFEKVGEKSCLGMDVTLDRATHDIPSWYDLGQHRPLAA